VDGGEFMACTDRCNNAHFPNLLPIFCAIQTGAGTWRKSLGRIRFWFALCGPYQCRVIQELGICFTLKQ